MFLNIENVSILIAYSVWKFQCLNFINDVIYKKMFFA